MRRWDRCFFWASLIGLAGCASTSVEDEVRAAPPIAYRIAIAPLEGDVSDRVMASEIQRQLVRRLQDLDTASEVFPVENLNEALRADLVVTPRITQGFQFTYEEATSGAVLSSLLWLGTWVGGLFVSDSSYVSEMGMSFEIQVAADPGQRVVPVEVSQKDPVELNFLERNSFISWPMVQSWIIPPFLTSDDDEVLGESVQVEKVDQIGTALARDLKLEFEGRELERCASVRFLGTPGEPSAALEFEVRAGSRVESIRVQIDDVDRGDLLAAPAADVTVESLEDGRLVKVRWPLSELSGGRHVVRVVATSDRRSTSRTLVLAPR